MKTYTTEQKIAYALKEMGIHQDLLGYKYLRVAIEAVVKKPSMIDSITKGLYPYVAERCYTTPMRVERAIRHAIETSWKEMTDDMKKNVFGNAVAKNQNRPANGHYIAAVAEIISEYDEHPILPKEE